METFDTITLSDTQAYIDILTKYAHLRNSYKIRHRHYTLDTERGYVEMARMRVEKMNEAAAEIEQLTPQVKQIVQQVDANLAADPKNKRARLLRLYCDVIAADVYEVQRLQTKISSLRSQVFRSQKPTDTTAASATHTESSLFD